MGVKNVPKADSTHICQAITSLMTERYEDSWRSKVVAVGCDGASVLLGSKNGVVQKLREELDNPYIHAIHCSAHRLELAYKDAVKKLSTATHQKCEALLLNLYLFYKYSSLNRANLMLSYNSLGIKSKVPTRVGGTRWLPHTKLALTNLSYGYDAIVQHLEQLQNPGDAASRKDSAAKAKSFLKLLTDKNMQLWFPFLLDVVVCLSMASEAIQKENSTLADIWNELESAKTILQKYKRS
ncbi:zinc finger protein 862-like [Mercenaria mercenaria]|uniref:zinc finger protein 862-like n=1 Tax=Mercenaria mercenaria TaxID=6596 RepID=UPI00234E94FE|nr:zinc finger protein 862-like [Mercenaria mercenaria]